MSNYFSRLKGRLSKTRHAFSGGFDKLFARKGPLDEELLEQIEELLITSDIGVRTSMELIERISAAKISSAEEVKTLLKREIESLLTACASPEPQETVSPHVTLVVGVNGTGKTTTIGKLAATATRSGQKVLIAAGDTFRAAATEQLQIWADRAGAQMIKHRENADPAAVAFDAASAALSRDIDLVLIDTAGRLHTKVNLMEELKKIKRSLAKKISEAPHEVLLVLDATTGQNALSQARLFKESLDVSGLVLTKLDGTAKGGIVVSICSELNIPIKYIGIGEDIDDLQVFDPRQFVEALI